MDKSKFVTKCDIFVLWGVGDIFGMLRGVFILLCVCVSKKKT